MRVISGSSKGRRLKTPADKDIRPTSDNVKEAIFNILGGSVCESKVLDLFAGSGQLAIEALSRGAESAVIVDIDKDSLALAGQNLKLCGFDSPCVKEDALHYISRAEKFDIVFVDPPYDSQMHAPVLEAINSFDILSDGGIIICEARRNCELPELVPPYYKLREYYYGSVKVVKYIKELKNENSNLPREL